MSGLGIGIGLKLGGTRKPSAPPPPSENALFPAASLYPAANLYPQS